jgi:hypothetical protein
MKEKFNEMKKKCPIIIKPDLYTRESAILHNRSWDKKTPMFSEFLLPRKSDTCESFILE